MSELTRTYYDPVLGRVRTNIDIPHSLAVQLENKADLVAGKIPAIQLPSISLSENLGTVANQAAMLLIAAEIGDFVTRTDTGTYFQLVDTDYTQLSSWLEFTQPSNVVLKSGSTMTGNLVLSSDATLSLHPVSLQQLNNKTHNSLASTQGGTTNEYYHLTSYEYNTLQATVNSSVVTISGTTYNITDADIPPSPDVLTQLIFTNSSPITVSTAFSNTKLGKIEITQIGTGQITFSGSVYPSGIGLTGKTRAQYSGVELLYYATNTAPIIKGDMA